MDKIVQKLAALGIPGLVVLAVAATTELVGGAAILVALATMGGPFGILGGIAVVALLALTIDAVAQWGFEAIAVALVNKLVEDGTSREEIRRKVNGYWMLSKSIKRKILSAL
jgi:hypothetical protein